jgi:hypothetical protein
LREVPLLRDLLGTELHALAVVFRKGTDRRHRGSTHFSVSNHFFTSKLLLFANMNRRIHTVEQLFSEKRNVFSFFVFIIPQGEQT